MLSQAYLHLGVLGSSGSNLKISTSKKVGGGAGGIVITCLVGNTLSHFFQYFEEHCSTAHGTAQKLVLVTANL